MQTWIDQVETLIRKRSSVRTYQNEILKPDHVRQLQESIDQLEKGPWKSNSRFQIVAASPGDTDALKHLGTYGMIQHPAGFIIGVTQAGDHGLLQFGYQIETLILALTAQEIGTCWLGGSFTKSKFAEHIHPSADELFPAVVSFGYPASKRRVTDRFTRFSAGSDKRKPWDQLFFSGDFSHPVLQTEEDVFNTPLEMVRLAPSASNRQPWRVVKERAKNVYHFYIHRNHRYQRVLKIGKLPDLQMVDMGIAISHFDLSLQSRYIKGTWEFLEPALEQVPEHTQYLISWRY